ncbi:hypothetical protein NFI96_009993 [Prochilodus magdalenae]|nr:hypothetical protein NFI96_009993 [Prochilodus magdalenae]
MGVLKKRGKFQQHACMFYTATDDVATDTDHQLVISTTGQSSGLDKEPLIQQLSTEWHTSSSPTPHSFILILKKSVWLIIPIRLQNYDAKPEHYHLLTQHQIENSSTEYLVQMYKFLLENYQYAGPAAQSLAYSCMLTQ